MKAFNPVAWLTVVSCLLSVAVTAAGIEARTITPSPYWDNEIVFPDDPFAVAGTSSNDPGWVKFAILLPPYDPGVVYFQDCKAYPFHYDFAVNHLDPFLGMTRGQFDQVSLYQTGQQVVLGAVILPPPQGWMLPPTWQEYGIQFVRQDAYTREEIRDLFNIVKAAVIAPESVEAFYFPAYEQTQTARDNRQWFESQGITISSTARWADANVCYSEGWALGRLKFFSAGEIASAFLSGELTSEDILLTDGIPAEIPALAGVITLSPATPNSHVAILARTFGMPFTYLALAEDARKAQDLVGRRIVLRVYDTWENCDVRLIDTEGKIDDATAAQLLALKTPPELNISAMTPYGDYSADTDILNPSDTKYFGGKAANFGILRTSIGQNCPVAAAFSFDLWNAFLDQTVWTHRTLREEIAYRLSGFTYPPADMMAMSQTLAGIRILFRDTNMTAFSVQLQNAVIATLQDRRYGFDPDRKIRFRSSTNVEDSEQFTGAGLYNSYSGCLADDLDGDATGPSSCDPTRNNERGVFRAIRRVFASFYNDNAYLERLRYGVDENEVGMGLLVHHSFPDEIELANGVATLSKPTAQSSWRDITLVTQLGATSVSNPTDGSIPEELSVSVYSTNYYVRLLQESNLVPLGDTVMDWQDDYTDLSRLLVRAGDRFEAVTGKSTYVLDFEYKKVAPDDKLMVKQIRQIPQPDTTPSIVPFLINDPAGYSVYQGEFTDVFANHRLKSSWRMQTKNMLLTDKNLGASLYSNVQLDYLHGCDVRRRTGPLSSWPAYGYGFRDNTTTDSWTFDNLRNARDYRLETSGITQLVSPAQSPILTLRDFANPVLHVDYAQPVPAWDWNGPTTTKSESVMLWPKPPTQPGDKLQTRRYQDAKQGISITTSFYWPPYPKGAVAGYTAPLVRRQQTQISGLTTAPIVLRGDYSQTYRPEHHNFGEHFLFEPRLEQGISPSILNELRLKDIRLLHFAVGMGPEDTITIYGFDKEMFATDLDGDGDIDAVDLALLGRYWQKTACGPCGRADFNGDNKVGVEDLAKFAFDWLNEYYWPN